MTQNNISQTINKIRQAHGNELVTFGEFLQSLTPEQQKELNNALLLAGFRWLNKIIQEEKQKTKNN